jgi:hypothetical protein
VTHRALSQRWDGCHAAPDLSEEQPSRSPSTVRTADRPAGSDSFCFDLHHDIPDFAIDRRVGQLMICKARQRNGRDRLHLGHDRAPEPRLPSPAGGKHYEHPETNENIRLAGGPAAVRYTILDATHRLIDGKLVRPAFTWGRFWRSVELFLRKIFFFLPENVVENIARPKRWKKRFKKLFK